MTRWSLALILLGALPAHAEVLPADVGTSVLNFGALCNGANDDTAAIQAAISAMPQDSTLKLPAGNCKVSDTIQMKTAAGVCRNTWSVIGEGKGVTRITLANAAPGFGDPNVPKPVFFFCSPPNTNNQAFHEHMRDLTINLGANNPGAIGIDFVANNVGSIRGVQVKSSTPCYTGIRLERQYAGPLLLKDVDIGDGEPGRGCQYGLRIAQSEYSITAEDLDLSGQTVAGVNLSSNVFTADNFKSTNTVPAVLVTNTQAFLTLTDAQLLGGTPGTHAIVEPTNGIRAFLRNIVRSGYDDILAGIPTLGSQAEWASASFRPFANSGGSLGLPQATRPLEYYTNPLTTPGDWASVLAFGATKNDSNDDTAAFQAALDSGRPIVYAPFAKYSVTGPLTIPASVRTIYLYSSQLLQAGTSAPADVFVVPPGTGTQLLTFHGAWMRFPTPTTTRSFVNLSDRPVALVDSIAGRSEFYGTGNVYLEDVAATPVVVGPSVHLWARQLDTENKVLLGTPNLICDHATCWVSGQKTEGKEMLAEAKNGACIEVLGGLSYPLHAGPTSMFKTGDGSKLSANVALSAYSASHHFATALEETRDGVTLAVPWASLPTRGLGAVMPLGSAHVGSCPLP